MPVLRWCILAAAFAFGTAFSADSAGRACVKEKGELGVAYNVHRTKLKEAYAPGGRRLVEGGHQVYEIEVPPLIKRDKPLHCTMSLASGLWKPPEPGLGRRFGTGSNPFSADERREQPTDEFRPPFTARERRELDW